MVEVAPAETVTHEGDTFQTVMAILIALVTIVGAVVAWRSAVFSERAGNADFASTTAVIHREETLTVGTARLFQRYRAYTDYLLSIVYADLLQEAMDSVSPEQASLFEAERTQANDEAINNLRYFETRYLDLEGNYDQERDLGEAIADASQTKDLDPAPHLIEADRSRTQIANFVSIFIVLAVALVFYTFAEALHPSRRVLRYSMAFFGTICLLFGAVAAVLVEMGLVL